MPSNDITENKANSYHQKELYDDVITTLMNSYGNEIYRYCRSVLRNDDDAQDLLQITFVQAFKSLKEFQGRSSFRTWLYAIARNRCLDKLKTTRRLRARVEFTDEPPDIAAEEPDHEDLLLSRALRECLEKLSDKVRDVVLMRFQSDLSYSEIAQVSKEKVGTLQARVARSLPALRECVERLGVSL